MVVCDKKRCIFIHIPKTAGTSIEQYLQDKGKNEITFRGVHKNRSMHHYTALELKKFVPIIFNHYYKFSIIRNPYDRLLSEYYWTPVPNLGFKYGKTKADFLHQVIDIVRKKKYYENIYYDHFLPQYRFVYHDKKLLVDQIFKYEDLDWVTNYLKKKLEINMDFPTFNKTNKKKDDNWTENQKRKIYNLYKNDFLIFNYEK